MDKLNHPIDLGHITDDQAIWATVEMWTDMMTTLGKKPEPRLRNTYKQKWLEANEYGSIYYPGTTLVSGATLVSGDCFLCERAAVRWHESGYSQIRCCHCPIYWPEDSAKSAVKCSSGHLDYLQSPIPDILTYIQDKKNRR